MNVDRATHVPAGVDGRELCNTAAICYLIAAKEFLTLSILRADVRVETERIAVPHVDERARQRRARAASRNRIQSYRDCQRHAGARISRCWIRAQVGTVQSFVDKV